jgi:hypothetical protein
MNQQIVFSTIIKWIISCENLEQLEVAEAAATSLYIKKFVKPEPQFEINRNANALDKCIYDTRIRIEKCELPITDEKHPLNLDVAGKD